MSLAGSTRLGPYEIVAALGAGGMGEVYRARDTKLNRDVALKLLPEDFASEKDRLARLRREAQVLASLNHPHVAAIYGLEEADGNLALVLELVEGEALDERLKRGAIPVEEALPLARQMAEGLEAAHEKGIVHRDLKPGNVKLTKDGEVKILDFGLAKAIEGETTNEGERSQSPTLSRRMTESGVILGTAGYMSPEQARGKAVDRRADIWAFGVVLFEMLSGRRLFSGETVSDTLAAVLRQEIDWNVLPVSTPASVRRLLERCLHRDPKQRLRDIGEARIAIEARQEATTGPIAMAPFWPRALALAAAAVLMTAGLTLWAPWRPAPEPPTPLRLSVELGAEVSLAAEVGPAAILSSDGKLLVLAARKAAGQPSQLYVRRLEQLAASPLAGTEDARDPFFSPDGQWIAFFAGGKLKKVSVTGGAAVTLCDATNPRGGTWGEDGGIVFTPNIVAGLSRVSSAGGTAEVLTAPDPAAGENTHRWPQALPGGKALLFTAGIAGSFDDASIMVQPLPKGPKKILQRGGYHGRYVPSGHLVYMHGSTLFATPFDVGRMELTGPPAPVLERVSSNAGLSGGAQFTFSERGTLVFLPGESGGAGVPIQWMDKDAKTEPLRPLAGNYLNIRFSPDGQRLAMDITDGKGRDVWIYEWGRDAMSRLTVDPSQDARQLWTPDGRGIVFSSVRGDKATPNLYWQRADGTGEPERLTESKNEQGPASWHPSGKFLAFHERESLRNWDIWILPMEGDEASGWKPGKPAAFLNSASNEADAAFSPDGRWLAYSSDESGRNEVYVRPFPGPGGKWLFSVGGGLFPTWSRTRKQLFYRSPEPESTLMAAPYAAAGDSFRAEKPRQWSPGVAPPRGGPTNRTFDLHPGGERFAVLKAVEEQAKISASTSS